MDESTKTVAFATGDGSLRRVVERVNAELARLVARGIAVDPAHVRFTLAIDEWGGRYVGSFGYRLPLGAEAGS